MNANSFGMALWGALTLVVVVCFMCIMVAGTVYILRRLFEKNTNG